MSFNLTTPRKITNEIKNVFPGHKPFYVKTLNYGPVGHCYLNCVKYINEHKSGRIVWGWTVWTLEAMRFQEIENHSIVRLNNGQFIDPTTPEDQEKKILFIPNRKHYPVIAFTPKDNKIYCYVKGYKNINYLNPTLTRKEYLSNLTHYLKNMEYVKQEIIPTLYANIPQDHLEAYKQEVESYENKHQYHYLDKNGDEIK